MTGQGLVLLALGLFSSLVITAAAVDHYLLSEHPVSEVGGLLWRVENTLSRARDLEISLASTQYGADTEQALELPPASAQQGAVPQTVRMIVQVIVGPSPVISVRYTEPEAIAGQIVTSDRDLLSHYLPRESLLVVRRWTDVPLAAVGLAGLDVSRLRAQWQQGLVDARISSASAGFASDLPAAHMPLGWTLTGASLNVASPWSLDPTAPSDSDLEGFASGFVPGSFDPLHGSYVVEVREAQSERLIERLWIDRTTYLVQKIIFFEDQRRVHTLEVERLVMDQGLTPDEVLALPRAAVTIGS